MPIYKNTGGQKVACYAYDSTNLTAKTGDAANITAQLSIDGLGPWATNDVNPTELSAANAPGVYLFDLTQGETNGDLITISPVSSTANIEIEPLLMHTVRVQREVVDSILPTATTSRSSILLKQGIVESFRHDAWDDKVYTPLLLERPDGSWLIYYTGYPTGTPSVWYPCVAQSQDLITWTKPNLGVHTYGGNTDNNILVASTSTVTLGGVMYAEGLFWLVCINDTSKGVFLYSSEDGLNSWTFRKTIWDGTRSPFAECKGLHFVDGKYRCYYSEGHLSDQRSLGFYEWYPALSGTPTDNGLMPEFTSSASTLQYYDIHVWEYGGATWACVPEYNSTTEVLGPLYLYRSTDNGRSFKKAGRLIGMGESGGFDENLISAAQPILVDGVWKMFYAGSDETHDVWPRTMRFGLAERSVIGPAADLTFTADNKVDANLQAVSGRSLIPGVIPP